MEPEEMIDCTNPTGKNKSAEFVCRIARNLQEKDVNVSFSEIEDALKSIHSLGPQIKDIDDLKSTLKPTLAKHEKSERLFQESFDKALKETYTSPPKKKVKESDVTKELEE